VITNPHKYFADRLHRSMKVHTAAYMAVIQICSTTVAENFFSKILDTKCIFIASE